MFKHSCLLGAVLALLLGCENDQVNNDFTAAARQGDLGKLNLLLDDGANIEARDPRRGATALMWSAHEGHNEIVRFLLQKGAAIDASQERQRSALWYAAQQGQQKAAEILLCWGADSRIESTPENIDSEAVARENGHLEIADTIKQFNVDPASLVCTELDPD